MNRKTTITSAISAAASFVLFAQVQHFINFPGWAMAIALFCQVGGLAAFGVMAKDYNVTGGTVPTTPEAERRVADK
jgi:hypothetical protein